MVIKKLKNKELLIALVAFLAGMGLMYIYGKQEVRPIKKLAARVVDNCMQALAVNNEIVANYKAINSEFVTCLTNKEKCNYKETANNLLNLTKERRILESKLNNISDQAQQIIDDTKKKY